MCYLFCYPTIEGRKYGQKLYKMDLLSGIWILQKIVTTYRVQALFMYLCYEETASGVIWVVIFGGCIADYQRLQFTQKTGAPVHVYSTAN